MIAIPVFRSRVAPVLNWCTKVLIFDEDAVEETGGTELKADAATSCFDRVRELNRHGVSVLICGALSPDLLFYARNLGIRVIHGVAGEVNEVLAAYRAHNLNQPCYRLPGCRRGRLYRGGGSEGPYAPCLDPGTPGTSGTEAGPGAAGETPGRRSRHRRGSCGERFAGGGSTAGLGPGGACICPECGETRPHQKGIPCALVLCPRCRRPMVRGREGSCDRGRTEGGE
jgi:predicted Fe-Mo cluster-binding NifX family protein